MLGTNDVRQPAGSDEWNNQDLDVLREQMKAGFLRLVRELKAIDSRPILYVMIPPIMKTGDLPADHRGPWMMKYWLPDLIREFSGLAHIPSDHIINLQEVITPDNLDSHLGDFVHPNDDGYKLISQKVFDTLIMD